MLTKTPQEICRNPTNKNLCKTTKILPTALTMMTTSTTTISMTTTTMITTTITTPKVYSIMIPTATIKKVTTAQYDRSSSKGAKKISGLFQY